MTPPESTARRWLVLVVICAAEVMMVLDFSIVTVALPDIEQALNFSQQVLQWVVSAYALAFGGFLLLGGLTQFRTMLLVARAFQGIGVAISITATSQVSESEEGLVSGLLTTSQQIGSALGLAVLVAVAAIRTKSIAGSVPAEASVAALTAGYKAALFSGACFAAIGVVMARLVIKRERKSAPNRI